MNDLAAVNQQLLARAKTAIKKKSKQAGKGSGSKASKVANDGWGTATGQDGDEENEGSLFQSLEEWMEQEGIDEAGNESAVTTEPAATSQPAATGHTRDNPLILYIKYQFTRA